MFLKRVQSASLLDALRATFDGSNPCMICRVVREGKAAEQSESATPAQSMKLLVKLELIPGSALPGLIRDGIDSVPQSVLRMDFRSRCDPPLQRPPRTV